MSAVPVIDLRAWFDGDRADRERVAARVDAALSEIGFLVVTGHGVPAGPRERIREAAGRFFALPEEVKARYAATVGERGWLPPGVEANGYAEGTPTPPDLKETFAAGADRPTGDAAIDAEWFQPNVWPAEEPELEPLVVDHLARMRALAGELLVICAAALGLAPDFFTSRAGHPSYTLNINRYPPLSRLGPPEPGQFRIGPHTDFGTVTVLDRQDGVGGLQVHTPEGGWANAPFVEDSFTINTGDLLARWTGDRWRSGRHRVLPPDPSAPDEELLSLVYFYECDPGAVIESLGPPVGRVAHPPVRASEFLLERLDAITLR
ncbi:2-oxoglutarate and iron-dependent oxygenase domain-containing protein [Actinomadura sp. DC4]|uniref:isopenicillin N synthase family dioxygenase n=1 Tax=Actinomadura sp. DC4 TaxID=3055069 RepID=UPI0025AFBA90|nr:2-oxoglutarate and iron-dependent oxygenase domain-containing protein [Actinomadura sp. DC4]MDN3352027.1 2-oxoglutarate and iron-dependent oxygenase domain-containing protein [Actinomadura sp. DC4]